MAVLVPNNDPCPNPEVLPLCPKAGALFCPKMLVPVFAPEPVLLDPNEKELALVELTEPNSPPPPPLPPPLLDAGAGVVLAAAVCPNPEPPPNAVWPKVKPLAEPNATDGGCPKTGFPKLEVVEGAPNPEDPNAGAEEVLTGCVNTAVRAGADVLMAT